jgi:VanZ family protein
MANTWDQDQLRANGQNYLSGGRQPPECSVSQGADAPRSGFCPLARRKLMGRGLGWCLCIALWTTALLTIFPMHVGRAVMPEAFHFPAAKFLHVSAYAFLTVYLKWLPLRRGRWLLLAFLSLHAFGTEFCQQFVPGRHGVLSDVLIDHLGLALGMILTRKCWLPRSSSRSSPGHAQENAPGLGRSSSGRFSMARLTAENADQQSEFFAR